MKRLVFLFALLMIAAVIATAAGAASVTISGPSQTWDATLRADTPNVNMGANVDDRAWRMFSDTNSVQRHHVMKFDLSGIAAGSTIASAKVGIYIRRYGGTVGDVTGYKISRLLAGKSWVEGATTWSDPAGAGEVTWNNQAYLGAAWDVAGATGAGDIDLASTVLWDQAGGLADVGYREIDITTLVQAWAGGAENNGMVWWGGAGGSDSSKYNYGRTKETSAGSGYVPYLTVEYTPAPVPEPSSLLAFGAFGVAGLGFIRRRRS